MWWIIIINKSLKVNSLLVIYKSRNYSIYANPWISLSPKLCVYLYFKKCIRKIMVLLLVKEASVPISSTLIRFSSFLQTRSTLKTVLFHFILRSNDNEWMNLSFLIFLFGWNNVIFYPPASKASRWVYWNQAQKNFSHPDTGYPWVSVTLSLCDSVANKPPIISAAWFG